MTLLTHCLRHASPQFGPISNNLPISSSPETLGAPFSPRGTLIFKDWPIERRMRHVGLEQCESQVGNLSRAAVKNRQLMPPSPLQRYTRPPGRGRKNIYSNYFRLQKERVLSPLQRYTRPPGRGHQVYVFYMKYIIYFVESNIKRFCCKFSFLVRLYLRVRRCQSALMSRCPPKNCDIDNSQLLNQIVFVFFLYL